VAGIFLLVFALLAASADAPPQFNIIYNFTGGADGAEPVVGLPHSADGTLHGVCAAAGNHPTYLFGGTIFRISTGASQHEPAGRPGGLTSRILSRPIHLLFLWTKPLATRSASTAPRRPDPMLSQYPN
jgi:hypothetical protein